MEAVGNARFATDFPPVRALPWAVAPFLEDQIIWPRVNIGCSSRVT